MSKPIEKTSTNGLQPDPQGGLWTSSQLARFLGCSERHVFNLRKRGMPAFRIGDMVRFEIEKVRGWIERGGADAGGDERAHQLADIAAGGDEDNAECAAADLAREQT